MGPTGVGGETEGAGRRQGGHREAVVGVRGETLELAWEGRCGSREMWMDSGHFLKVGILGSERKESNLGSS